MGGQRNWSIDWNEPRRVGPEISVNVSVTICAKGPEFRSVTKRFLNPWVARFKIGGYHWILSSRAPRKGARPFPSRSCRLSQPRSAETPFTLPHPGEPRAACLKLGNHVNILIYIRYFLALIPGMNYYLNHYCHPQRTNHALQLQFRPLRSLPPRWPQTRRLLA